MKFINRFLLVAILFVLGMNNCFANAEWPLWNLFLENHYEDGRIVDHFDKREITTSEGQSYAMFFALVNGDKERFKSLLAFTEEKLAKGSFKDNLPAWLYGKNSKGNLAVLDDNNAVDSDLWIAYSLVEAGRLWNEPSYTEKGMAIINKLMTSCVYKIASNSSSILLPGAKGFVNNETGIIKLNPSYYPLFIMEKFSRTNEEFAKVYYDTMQLVLRGFSSGFAPDWLTIDTKNNNLIVNPTDLGSYDAIRVYLWLGLTSKSDSNRYLYEPYISGMLKFSENNMYVPEKVHIYDISIEGKGGAGFDACLIPLANNKGLTHLRTSVLSHNFTKDEYYSHNLALFALGYDEGRYFFAEDGSLIINSKNVYSVGK